MDNLAISFGSKLLKALGNAKRLEILYHLQHKELKVGELENMVGLSAISAFTTLGSIKS